MTKEQLITQFKIDYPTLQIGNDQDGYTQVDAAEYEATIKKWADNVINDQSILSAKQTARDAAQAKLKLLGLDADDLAALGL